jgi:two-component system cell cycle response regulator CtrA
MDTMSPHAIDARAIAALDFPDLPRADVPDWMPETRLVDPVSLVVDEKYQRGLSDRSIRLIRKIVSEWSWLAFKPPIVVEVGERLHVIDGQHTAIGAVTHGGIDDLLQIQRHRIGQLEERIRQLEEALMPASVRIPIEYGLTATEARVFSHLASREFGTRQSIMLALYSDRIEEPEEKIVDVFVCKLRRKLNRFGVRIETIWGQGWRLASREVAA